MRGFFTLFGREVRHNFHQPLAYVVLFFFLLLTGFDALSNLNLLNHNSGVTSLVEAFFNSFLFWFPFVLVFPLITMRLFSEEYSSGTIETLMTAPVRDWQVVLSKFLGAYVLFVVLWAPSALYFVIFQWLSGQGAASSGGSYLGAYALILLVGLFYISIGCLASAMTRNQIVAAVVCFALISMMFFLNLLSYLLPNQSDALRELTYYFSTVEHMAEFSRGMVDSRPAFYYVSMTAFTLFLTLHVFQYRRWKK